MTNESYKKTKWKSADIEDEWDTGDDWDNKVQYIITTLLTAAYYNVHIIFFDFERNEFLWFISYKYIFIYSYNSNEWIFEKPFLAELGLYR